MIFKTDIESIPDVSLRGSDYENVENHENLENSIDTENCDPDLCVPFHLCKNNTINRDGIGILDARFNPNDKCHYLEVCCKLEDMKDRTKDYEQSDDDLLQCGRRFTEGIGVRILENENESQYGEFPWMIAVMNEMLKNGKTVNVYACGGSLIHPEVVVTAAHCINTINVNQIKIRAGEWDTQTTNEIWPTQDRYVKKVIIHEKFYVAALQNDIALLILKNPVGIVGNIRTICLPPQNFIFDNSICFASGWGKDLFGKEGSYQVILKKVELPIVPYEICSNVLRKTRLGRHFILHESFLCAGGIQGKDTCKGDGGSPLVCPIKPGSDKYYLAGIVSWGIGCGENNVPGIYVNVAKYRNWIDKNILKFGLSTAYYTLE